MPDKFTPLTLGSLPPFEAAAGSASQATTTSSPAVSPFRSLPGKPADAATDACAKPVINLQRNAAGVVTSIRVQCGCGKVTELNCVY